MRPPQLPQWTQFRQREDLTDYVIHLTRGRFDDSGSVPALQVLLEILRSGHLRPTFALFHNRPTIQGPDPAVCLTEMPLRYILHALDLQKGRPRARLDGYGIAYHKVDLHKHGGRPAWYATFDEMRRLPAELLYLYAEYEPIIAAPGSYPRKDFTWEREWRAKASGPGLPVVLPQDADEQPRGALIVGKMLTWTR
jgi:hypothetical protein